MDLALLVYGISLLDGLDKFFVFLTIISAVVAAGSGIFTLSNAFESYEYSWNLNKDGTLKQKVLETRAAGAKLFKRSSIVLLVVMVIQIFLPSQKTAYTMVGAYAAQKVVENKGVQQTSDKVMTIINQKLDKYIDEGIQEATDEVKSKSKRNRNKD